MRTILFCKIILLCTKVVFAGHLDTLLDSANLLRNQHEMDVALHYYIEAEKLAKKENNLLSLANIYKNLGTFYSINTDYDKALVNYDKGIDLFIKLNDSIGLASCFNNKGIAYDFLRDYEKALMYYKKSLFIKKNIHLPSTSIASTLSNIGEIYRQSSSKPDSALFYYEQALEIHETSNDTDGIAIVQGNIGNVFLNEKQYKKAIYHLKIGLDFSIKARNLRSQAMGHLNLSITYDSLQNSNLALYHFRKHKELNDQLFDISKNREIANMQTKFETEKKENEIRLLKQKQELTRSRLMQTLYILVGGCSIILLIILISFLYFRYQSKTKLLVAQQELNTMNEVRKVRTEERVKLADVLHSRTLQTLSYMKMNLGILKDKDPKISQANEMLKDTIDEVRTVMDELDPDRVSSMIKTGTTRHINEEGKSSSN